MLGWRRADLCSEGFYRFGWVDDSSGIYILTVCDGLSFSEEEKADIRAEYELEDTVRISEKIEVVFHGDLRIPAEIAGGSWDRRSVLKTFFSLRKKTH